MNKRSRFSDSWFYGAAAFCATIGALIGYGGWGTSRSTALGAGLAVLALLILLVLTAEHEA